MQTYTVPAGVTSVTIEAYGAQGGGTIIVGIDGGMGAIMKGNFGVTAGQNLTILVGGQGLDGINSDSQSGGSGGGGTFVVDTSGNPLTVAG